jgi:hypothetical protein
MDMTVFGSVRLDIHANVLANELCLVLGAEIAFVDWMSMQSIGIFSAYRARNSDPNPQGWQSHGVLFFLDLNFCRSFLASADNFEISGLESGIGAAITSSSDSASAHPYFGPDRYVSRFEDGTMAQTLCQCVGRRSGVFCIRSLFFKVEKSHEEFRESSSRHQINRLCIWKREML